MGSGEEVENQSVCTPADPRCRSHADAGTVTRGDHAAHLGSLDEMLAPERQAVEAADAAYESALGTEGESAARTAYNDARTDYRIAERNAFDSGHYWTCGRCDGSGVWVNGGVCFNCGGSGFHPNQTPHKFQAAPPLREKRYLAAVAKRQAEQDALDAALAALPEPVAAALRASEDRFQQLNGYYGDGEEMSRDEVFTHGLYGKLRKYGKLSAAQIAAVERGLERAARRAAEDAALADAEPLAEGKREVEGEVVSTKVQHSAYGSALKMLVKQDDGNKVWGTVPRTLEDRAYDEGFDLVGQRVRFTATVERSDTDEHFGFFKRPGKVKKV